MNINEFENHLKGLFQGQNDEQLDTDEVWNDIKDRLEEDKRRKPFFWLFFGLGGLLLGILLFTFWPQTTEDFAQKTEISSNTPLNTATESTTASDKPEINLSTAPEQTVRVTKRNGRQQNRLETSSRRPSGTVLRPSKETNPTSNIVFEQSVSPSAPPSKDESLEIQYLSTFPMLGLRPQKAISSHLLDLPSTDKAEEKVAKARKTKPRRPYWLTSIEAFGGPNYGARILNSDREPGIVSLRKSNERVLPGFSIGSNFQMTSSYGLILYGGLEFQQVNERLKFNKLEEESVPFSGVTGVIVNNQGQVIDQMRGTVNRTRTTTRNKVHYNAYRMFHFTAGIGKRFTNIKLFDLEWTAGVDWNLISFYKGEIQDGNENFVELGGSSLVSNLYYQRQSGFGLRSGLTFNRFVGERTSLFIRPDIRMPLKTMTSNTYEVTHKHILFSLKVGGRIYL